MPSAFYLNCAAHLGNVKDFKVVDFSGCLLWMNSVLQLYGTSVWKGLKQILLDIQNKTYFKIKYIAHTHSNKSYIS